MKVACVISSLGTGGAERVLTGLANSWASGGWSVTIITLSGDEEPPAYPLSDQINVVPLGVASASTGMWSFIVNTLRRRRVLRSALVDAAPDVTLAFMDRTNSLTLWASRGLRAPVVIAERIHPGHQLLPRFWRILRRLTYRSAACLVAQTKSALEWHGATRPSRCCVIPNPVSRPPKIEPCAKAKRIVTVGRLVEQKGFSVLIEAFALIADRCADWELVVWGEGVLREPLEAQVRQADLSNRIHFAGVTEHVHKELGSSEIFVLSSLYEGFPNALLEAMSCGVAVVSTDCPSGPGEIVSDGANGLLVPVGDARELADAIMRLIDDPELRLRLGQAATEVITRFDQDRIQSQWTEVLKDASRVGGVES